MNSCLIDESWYQPRAGVNPDKIRRADSRSLNFWIVPVEVFGDVKKMTAAEI